MSSGSTTWLRRPRPRTRSVVLDKLEEVFDRSEEWRCGPEDRPRRPLQARRGSSCRRHLTERTEHEPRRALRWLRLAGGDDWGSAWNSNAIRAWIEASARTVQGVASRERYAQCRESVGEHSNACTIDKSKEPLHGAKDSFGLRSMVPRRGQTGRRRTTNLAKFWFEEAWYALPHDPTAPTHLALEHLETLVDKSTFHSLCGCSTALRLTSDLEGEYAARSNARIAATHSRERRQKRGEGVCRLAPVLRST